MRHVAFGNVLIQIFAVLVLDGAPMLLVQIVEHYISITFFGTPLKKDASAGRREVGCSFELDSVYIMLCARSRLVFGIEMLY